MKTFLIVGLLLATVITLHLLSFPVHSLAANRLLDALHAPGFGLLALGILVLLKPSVPSIRAYPLALLLTMLIAGLAETAQLLVSRQPSLGDLGHDLIGASGTFLLMAGASRERLWLRAPMVRISVFITGIALIAVAINPAVSNANVLAKRHMAFPGLASFEKNWETGIYRSTPSTVTRSVDAPVDWAGDSGNKVLAVQLGKERYAGFVIDVAPDWTGYEALRFEVRSDDQKFHELFIRIHDADHNQAWGDRYNDTFDVSPAIRIVRIPIARIVESVKDRRFRLDAVSQIVIIKVGANGDERILFNNFYLE